MRLPSLTVTRHPILLGGALSLVLAVVASLPTGLVNTQPALATTPGFQSPFTCGEIWRGATYAGHTSKYANGYWSVDFNTNVGDNGANTGGDSWEVNRPVRSSAAGTVVTSTYKSPPPGYTSDYGNYVEIDHGGGWKTLYAHMAFRSVSVDDVVSAGQQIGGVGNTHNVPTHLHYEQIKDNVVQAAVFNGAAFTYTETFNGNPITSANCPAAPNVGTRLLGDVNADGKADAVVMFRDTGNARVALANPAQNRFDLQQPWSNDPWMSGADKYFLGDVNGDGRADLVGFWNAGGVWKVMGSNGAGFVGPPTLWATNQGIGTTRQWVADVNGDGRSDTMTFDAGSGDWYGSMSTGGGFGPNQQLWSHGNGIGSSDQVVADFTGDSKADLGVYFASNGYWWITPSAATPPFGAVNWSQGHGLTSNKRFVGDVNGDGRADEAFFFTGIGYWDNGISTGGAFIGPTRWAEGQGVGTTEQFLADVTGDGKADLVTFDVGQGDWNVDASSGGGFWPPVLWIHGHGAGS